MVGVVLTTASTSHAVIIAEDSFESYVAGSQLNGQNGGNGFTAAWSVPAARQTEVTVEASGLTYSGGQILVEGGANAAQYVASEGGIEVIAGRSFAPQAGNGPLYLSFLYQNSDDAGPGSGDDFNQLGFETDPTNNPKASAMDRNTEYQLRSTTASANSVLTSVTSTAGETALLVLRIEKTGGSTTYNDLQLFVNPTFTDEASNFFVQSTIDSDLDLSGAAALALRKAFQEAGDTYLYDAIRISDSFADAVHFAIPEPMSAGLLGMAGLTLLRRRRQSA